MPLYRYVCTKSGEAFDAKSAVDTRDAMTCACGCAAARVFQPTSRIFVHSHFGVSQSGFLPDRDDKSAWENVSSIGSSGSQVHAPKQESFTDYFERTVNQFG